MRSARPTHLCAVAVLALAMVGCGNPVSGTNGTTGPRADSGAAEVYAKFSGLHGEQRRNELVKAAKEEGSLTIYTCSSDTADIVAPAFSQKYGIEVEAVSTGTNVKLRQRALQEQSAGGVRADLVESLGGDMFLLDTKGVLAPYESDVKSELPERANEKGWTRTYESIEMLAWNTNLVQSGDVPSSFSDLADPRWRDQITMVNGSTAWYAGVYRYFTGRGMSDEQFSQMMGAIAGNSRQMDGHSSSTSLMIGGSFKALLQTEQFDVLQNKTKNAPIAAEPYIAPIVVIPAGMGLTASAIHPAAALLFMDYYLTEGQGLIAGVYRSPVNTSQAGGLPWIIQNPDLLVEAPQDILGDPEKFSAWSVAYNNLLRGAGDVLPAETS